MTESYNTIGVSAKMSDLLVPHYSMLSRMCLLYKIHSCSQEILNHHGNTNIQILGPIESVVSLDWISVGTLQKGGCDKNKKSFNREHQSKYKFANELPTKIH